MRLHYAADAAGVRLVDHQTLPSTNTEALMLARHGERSPYWVTARIQTAGRGRRGNEWISEAGNLYATLLLSDPSRADIAPELSFVAALAVHDAICERAAALRDTLKLKWPNDVLLNGKKVAGILVEGETIGGALAVAIGIGVNCAHHPPRTLFPATDLAAAGVQVSAEQFFLTLSGTMFVRLEQWRRGLGFAAIRSDWIVRAAGIGEDLRVRLPGREFSGRWEGLDDRGRLLLRLADGSTQTVTAGDVFPLVANAQGAH